ncbi:MAG: alpha-glucosidase/alpha-galactosidase [Eubacteriales bacterium]|nr:alpha-glucosidase/alpha-galactosidase [Eubacteriales bacterium]
MRYEKDCVKDLRIAYIGGGSRDWAWCFMQDLALERQMEGVIRLYDIDREAAQHNAVIGNRISAHAQARSRWRYEVADSLAEALDGADFVIISILPGTFDEMESDVHAPERCGVYQAVGDTVGPGGCVRALRTIPMYVTIAEAIREHAPQAWVINYTNPMAQCVATLYEVFPQVKAIGCCHEVFHAMDLLCCMLRDKLGVQAQRQQLRCTLAGVNHFTWITSAYYGGLDLFPMFAEFCREHLAEGYDETGCSLWRGDPFKSAHRALMDMFLRYGAIPAAGDRHLTEFLPPWYLKDSETVRQWRFGLTPVSWRKEDLQARLARSERLRTGEEEICLTPSGEEGHLIMKALLGLGDMLTNVNLPNRGQIPGLPLRAVVETNAYISRSGVSPVMDGALPEGVLGLVMPHALNQLSVLRAAMTGDRELAFRAFLNEPLMQGVAPDEARALFAQMLRSTAAYLPEAFRG